eukprot:1160807-Pyramimonas_sp.AAC.1
MGGKWIKFKSMQERLAFLDVDEEFIDEFEESFERYQVESTSEKKDEPAAPAEATPGPKPKGKRKFEDMTPDEKAAFTKAKERKKAQGQKVRAAEKEAKQSVSRYQRLQMSI